MENRGNQTRPIAKSKNIVTQESGDELLIYDLKENRALCLNNTAKAIWKMCDGNRTVADISNEFSMRSKTFVSDDLIKIGLNQLEKDGLLIDGKTDYLEGMSRRDAIRKAGFAAIIALPIISTVVAPEALAAQSLLPLQAACTANGECASGNCTTFGNPVVCCNPGSVNSQPPGNTLYSPVGSACPPSAFNCCSFAMTDNGAVPRAGFPGGMAQECECAPF